MHRFVKTLVLVTLGLAIAAFAVSTLPARGAAIGDRPAAMLSITLYGSFAAPTGWGWAATNITEPGPTLTVHQGDVITFHLFSHDAPTGHILVIDLNNNQVQDGPDQASLTFSSATVATNFTFTASTAGTFNYFCGVHGYAAQHGSLVVQSTGGGGGGGTSGGIDTTLLIGGVVIIVAVVAVVAAIVMRRKKP